MLRKARADYVAARLDWERTQIRAPVQGMITRRHVQVGESVRTMDDLMTIVPLGSVWVDANMKENQLAHIRIGQPVRVTTDMYGNQVALHGRVVGVSAGSGSAFALLPPQNAVGNWIKVVQRVPVRIALDSSELQRYPLRIGLSVTATIDTHDRRGSLLANAAFVVQDQQTAIYAHQLQQAERAADAMVAKDSMVAKGKRL